MSRAHVNNFKLTHQINKNIKHNVTHLRFFGGGLRDVVLDGDAFRSFFIERERLTLRVFFTERERLTFLRSFLIGDDERERLRSRLIDRERERDILRDKSPLRESCKGVLQLETYGKYEKT